MFDNGRPARSCARPTTVVVMLVALVFVAAAAFAATPGGETRRLLRYPDVRGDLLVFVHGDDIWSVPAQGGVARRLTFHEGSERYPRISPDGKLIAFTGEYDGNTDVYVMNVDGGDLRRVTWHPGDDEVIGWRATDGKILFRSSRSSFERFQRLFLVNPDGSGLEELPLPEAAWGSFSPDGKQIVYTRVATEDRTWKRYRGGLAPDLYLYDFTTKQDRRLTDFPGTDAFPLWIGDAIYFNSDRDGVLNIYRLDPATGKTEQITKHRDYDARRPSGAGPVVYELGGSLQLLDVPSGRGRQVPVEIRSDMPDRRPYLKSVADDITDVDVSPGGERAVIVARGEVFTVPRTKGPIRNLTRDPGSRDKDAVWSPDGSKIAYVSDRNGEYEIYVVDALGKTPPVKVTQHKDGYRHTLRWSPDGQKIAFADQTLWFYTVNTESKMLRKVDHAELEPMDAAVDSKPISDFAWSPDSAYIAYSIIDDDLVSRIFIYSLETDRRRRVSTGPFNDFNPVFSRDGQHLFFVSNRRFDPTFDDLQYGMVYKKVAGVYALTLRKDGRPLFPLESDEVGAATGGEKGTDSQAESDKREAPKPKPEKDKSASAKEGGARAAASEDKSKSGSAAAATTVIDWDGLYSRVEALPLPPGNYRELAVSDKSLFYLDSADGDYNRFEFRDLPPRTLYAFDFATKKTRKVIAGIEDYRLSRDGAHIVHRKPGVVGIIDASAEDSKGEPLDLADLKMWIDPPAEWRQIFNEAWRIERDFFYDRRLRGLDWDAVREKYAALLPFASNRRDVTYLIGEMIGELSTSHTYVRGGDQRRRAERVNTGMLGADYELDAATGRHRFKKIFRGHDWTRGVMAPLDAVGLDVREGDYLLAVNGVDVKGPQEVYSYFQGLAGQQVTLLVNDKPTPAGAREVTVKPLADEMELRYLDWTERNREVVDKASEGLIGYVHLPDTFTGSAREFPKYFFSQTQKQGLIIDGRFNHGGLDPYPFLEQLNRPTLAYWTRRYSRDQSTPYMTTRSYLVMLTNRQAGSGGDELPAQFRQLEMGPIIGTRTWGGLVGISAFYSLIDGGRISAPDYRIYTPEGQWTVENEGVAPDIEVDLDPAQYAQGVAGQLMKAVEVLMEKIRTAPRAAPQRPSIPPDKEAPAGIRRSDVVTPPRGQRPETPPAGGPP